MDPITTILTAGGSTTLKKSIETATDKLLHRKKETVTPDLGLATRQVSATVDAAMQRFCKR
jgi:hypothetical protein